MRLLLSHPYLHISLHEGSVPVLELQWLSYVGSADFRDAVNQALLLSQEHQVQGWVTDDRLQGAIRPRDLEWVEQEILPPLDKVGIKRFAQLEAQDALQRRTVDTIYVRTMPLLHFEVCRFEDISQARIWASGG